MPVSKTRHIGFQLVNGWNNVTKGNGGVTGVFTNALRQAQIHLESQLLSSARRTTTPPAGLRNLIDTTLLLTPTGKFNAYFNYDYGQNQDASTTTSAGRDACDDIAEHWQGVAVALHDQATAKQRLSGTL